MTHIKAIGWLLMMFVFSFSVQSQNLTLNHCLEKGMSNFPLNQQHQFISENTALLLKTLNTHYYPRLDVTGQFTWQNDVPHVSVEGSPFQIPYAPKDQYKSYVDVKQVIYDGGTTKAAKKVEELKGEVNHQKVKTDVYGVRSGIINSYFLILALEEQMLQFDYKIDNLTKRLDEVEVMVKNGVALSSNADVINVEILKLRQSRYGLEEARHASVEVLSEYVGEALSDSIKLTIDSDWNPQITIGRPELHLFEAQRQQLYASSQLVGRNRIPKVSGYSQVGYGNPGFNVLLDSFEPFYMVGIRLNWNIWDWKATSNKKQVLAKQGQMITAQEEAFLKSIKIGSQEIRSRIRKMERMLDSDIQIIELRERITQSSQTQLNSGVIMASDYIADLNKESIAQLSYQLHQIELYKAKAELANLLGSKL